MTPGERYRDELARGVLLPDPAQAALVEELDRVHRSLLARRDAGLLARLARRFGGGSEPVRGLYVWGGVGRGKTHLVDLFYRTSSLDPKLRIHFHRFMQHVHGELNALPDREDPLEIVAARIAKRARVLCFDEFHVSDITDAMILGRLLAGLLERGTTLVATSNIEPSRLYADGLQRERFLPAIDLIERHTKVVRLESGADYRLRALERARTWYSPLGPDADRGLAECFGALAPEDTVDCGALTILGRSVSSVRHAEGIAWFDFETLCGGPRSVADYIEIARDFHSVILSGVPVLDDERRDPVRRFIHLVDELYERNVNLIVSAAAPPDGLYRGRRLAEPFERTRSRLVEMRSTDYLGREHIP
ncbi:MAG: cell division protein ZapE [Chromatiales bacterium]|nr:cell division protein ZapE [Chromatiales bacterium]